MSHPIVIHQTNESQGNFLLKIVDSAYNRRVHFLDVFSDCKQFVKQNRINLIYLGLSDQREDKVEWIGNVPDDVVGMISREWTDSELRPFIDAGLSDYVFKPYQPEQITKQVKRRNSFWESNQ